MGGSFVMKNNVGAVIVTYNRIDKLKKALESYSNQTFLPQYIIVVNNSSTDGTDEFLKQWQQKAASYKKYVITMDENLGGSGGFYAGEKAAMKLDADWIMIADDDAYPESNYIARMMEFISQHDSNNISVVCGSVLENGTYLNNHRGILTNPWKLQYKRNITAEEIKNPVLSIDLVSYVGILINKNKLKKVGLVNKDYFIWNDDIEHSIRLRTVGKIIYLPQYIIMHDCDVEHVELSWKSYYGNRNRIDLFRRHFFLQFLFTTFIYFLKTLVCPIKGRSFTEVKLRLHAIHDGVLGILGKDKTYRPGWKP